MVFPSGVNRGLLGGLALAGLVALPGRIVGQDVMVTPPAWSVQRDAPGELPVLKTAPKVEFPAELKVTPDLGYVVCELLLDQKGKVVGFHPRGSLAAYSRAAGVSASWAWNAGRRDGKGVNTATTYAVIFNPATAAEKIPDATPRLLDVTVVQVDAPKRAKPPTDGVPDRVELADLSIDEQGRVTAVRNAPAGLEREFSVAVKNWRFAPARRGGQPVAAEVRAPFIVTVRDAVPFRSEGKPTQPRVILQRRPIYPFALRANGMRGEVVVDFVVDIEGRVRNAFVVRTLNPSFDDPALEAVAQWRFEPGRIGERPVNTHLQVPILFVLNETGDGGRGPMTEEGKVDLSKLPEQFRYDTPPRPVGTVRPVYPYALLRAKKEGKAVVRFVVDQAGRVAQADIGESTAPELGRALQAAIECFSYEPALKGGRPSLALQAFVQQFERDERWQLVGDQDRALLRREEKKPETILTLKDLDGKLVVRSRKAPRFPLSLKESVTTGEALIEFLVDEDGRARLPRIVSATAEAFGYAAVQGVTTWRFEPPLRGGRPVVVRVQIPITFALADQPAGKK